VTVKPEDGYGKVDPKAEIEVGRERVPPDVKVGSQLTGRGANGESRAVRVKEIKDKSVVLDLNHPLAGKTLVFDVRILSVDGP
jgi:FKBP-type peptidyl-prolyl cis-trans isomerase SlyD